MFLKFSWNLFKISTKMFCKYIQKFHNFPGTDVEFSCRSFKFLLKFFTLLQIYLTFLRTVTSYLFQFFNFFFFVKTKKMSFFFTFPQLGVKIRVLRRSSGSVPLVPFSLSEALLTIELRIMCICIVLVRCIIEVWQKLR